MWATYMSTYVHTSLGCNVIKKIGESVEGVESRIAKTFVLREGHHRGEEGR